jgi:hypothetical protein
LRLREGCVGFAAEAGRGEEEVGCGAGVGGGAGVRSGGGRTLLEELLGGIVGGVREGNRLIGELGLLGLLKVEIRPLPIIVCCGKRGVCSVIRVEIVMGPTLAEVVKTGLERLGLSGATADGSGRHDVQLGSSHGTAVASGGIYDGRGKVEL